MNWATKYRKHQPVTRDDVELEIVYAGQTMRKISVKEAAVLGYTETYDSVDGLGRFELVIQQHCFGDREHCYVPVPQKDGSLLHVVYRLDLFYLDSLDELAGLKQKTLDLHALFEDNQWVRPYFTGNEPDQSSAFQQDWFCTTTPRLPFSISFSLIRWDRETVYGQLELDLTTSIGRELLGNNYPVIQDRIGQLIADGYGAKDAMLDGGRRTVGSKTVKCDLAEWYQVSAGEKRMKITAPRIKLEYNNIHPKETKGSGIPGILAFVKATTAATAATAQAEAAPGAEVVATTSKAEKPTTVSKSNNIDTGKTKKIAPGGGLQTHEAKGGHLISRHVGKSDAELIERVQKNPKLPGASSFTNLEIAEEVTYNVLTDQKNTSIIKDWLAKGRLVLDYQSQPPTILGRGVAQGSTVVKNLYNARIVLKSDKAGGYYILTGYPK